MRMSEEMLKVIKGYKVMDGKIFTRFDENYVVLEMLENGLLVKPSAKPVENEICLKRGYKSGQIYLPNRVLKAYNIGQESVIDKLTDGSLFLRRKRRTELKPMYIADLSLDKFELKNRMPKEKNINGKTISFTRYEAENLGYSLRVEVSLKDKLYIHISKASKKDMETLPTIQQLGEEYGATLAQYPYDHLVYLQYVNDKVSKEKGYISLYHIPPFAIKCWNIITSETKIAIYKEDDDSLVLVPELGYCVVDDEPLQPATEGVREKLVCEHCYDPEEEKNELKEMVSIIKQIHEKCVQIDERNASLREENARLQKKLQKMDDVFKALSNYVNTSKESQ